MKIAALCLALLASSANAGTVGVHLLSFHSAGGYQTLTPGIFYRSGPVVVGAFRNSEGRGSAYAGWHRQYGAWATTAGLVTGYERAKVLPMFVVTYKLDDHFRLGVVPNPKGAWALHLAYEF